MNELINEETICNAIRISWQAADTHKDLEMKLFCWHSIDSELTGILNIANYGHAENYNEIKDVIFTLKELSAGRRAIL